MTPITTWIKISNHFIRQENIRAISRHGHETKIKQIIGEDIIVSADYEKVKALLPSLKK